jgi:hypothetical protein
MQNPTDAIIAARLGELELKSIRLGWALEQYQGKLTEMAKQLSSKDALLAAKDAEIERLKEAAKSPALPLDDLPANPYEDGEMRH